MCCIPETNIILYVNYTSIKIIKFFKVKENECNSKIAPQAAPILPKDSNSSTFEKLLFSRRAINELLVYKQAPYTLEKERRRKEADHSRLVGGRFNLISKGTCKACLGRLQLSSSRASLPGAIKVYEALMRCSHVFNPGGLNNTLPFQGCVPENGSSCGNCGRI